MVVLYGHKLAGSMPLGYDACLPRTAEDADRQDHENPGGGESLCLSTKMAYIIMVRCAWSWGLLDPP